jgi:uncharacterized protein
MQEAIVMKNIKESLSDLVEIEKVILFGSRATGKAEAHCDWDVLVIGNSSLPFIERQGQALAALRRRDYALDLLLYTPAEAEVAASILGSAVYWATREGRVIYAK